MDYKKLYLEQKQRSLQLEMNLIQMRAMAIEKEMPTIEEELRAHVSKDTGSDTDKT